MRAVVLCATLAAFALPSTVGAQSVRLTEADALARFSPESPRVRALRSDIEVAKADVMAANRWPNPRVTYDRESVAGVREDMFMVSQVLPVTGRRGFAVDAASALVDATGLRADEALRRARADLRIAFAQLVAAQARERELTAGAARIRDLAGILARREAAGDTAGFDRLRAEREGLELDADLAAAATERAQAQARLAGYFTDPFDPVQLVAADDAPARSDVPPLEALLERAETVRGDLLALQKDLDAARFSLKVADRSRVPEPEVVVGTKSSTLPGAERGGVLTLQASLPLFDRNAPERALATARASQASVRAEALRRVVRADVAALRAVVIERRGTAERYRRGALAMTGELERIAQVSYDAGERGILELLDAYRTSASARLRQAALEAAVRDAEIELAFASGWEIR